MEGIQVGCLSFTKEANTKQNAQLHQTRDRTSEDLERGQKNKESPEGGVEDGTVPCRRNSEGVKNGGGKKNLFS